MTITVTYDPEKWKLVPVECDVCKGKRVVTVLHNTRDCMEIPCAACSTTPPTGKTEAEIKAEVLDEAAEYAINLAITTCADGITCKLIAENFRQLANQYGTKEGG